MAELKPKPCPFCGNTNLNVCYFSVFCDARYGGCGASSGGLTNTEEDAIKKWNRRVNDG